MANLRTNNLSGEQGQNAYRGSLGFHDNENSTDYLQVGSAGDFNYLHDGTSDWTAEFFIRSDQLNHRQTVFSTGGNSSSIGFACRIMEDGASGGSNGYKVLCQFSRGSSGNYLGFLGGVIDNKDFSHVALVFTTSNKQLAIYINGQLTNSSDLDGTANGTFGSGNFSSSNSSYALTIGRENYGTALYLDSAFLSNLRIVEGETVYTAAFTPPTSELTIIPNTTLLCCQDSNVPTQEATGKTITANGNFASAVDYDIKLQPKVIPPYGVDAGNAFGGPIQQSTQGYMYFPTGRTEERGGSRGVCAGGSDPSGRDNDISFIDIQSQGNAIDFGDLSINSHNTAGFSSKTRAIFSFGYIDASPNVSNTLEFITMMTQGNATDFGDTSFTTYEGGAASNDTRGLVAGGYNASPVNNVTNIDFVTIATLGNGSDFGDLTVGRRGLQGCGSPTRSVFASGYQQPDTGTKTNVIDFVTIATAGNAQDFGDLTSQRWGTSACADSTRGVFSGGLTPSDLNVIDFITIATTGNATDFGDLTEGFGRGSSTSNSVRGVNFHGIDPYTNTIGFVIIQTTGNEVDFGDNTYSSHGQGSGSTAHGGLS